jgi:hypothetical protein
MRRRVMARLGIMFLALCLPLAFAGPAHAGSQFDVHFLPAQVKWTEPGECIGGEICGGAANTIDFFLPLSGPGVVRSVTVFAHDEVEDSANAVLEVFLDGRLVGSEDVKKAGSYLVYPVNGLGYHLQLKSRNRSFQAGGEETVVLEVTIR